MQVAQKSQRAAVILSRTLIRSCLHYAILLRSATTSRTSCQHVVISSASSVVLVPTWPTSPPPREKKEASRWKLPSYVDGAGLQPVNMFLFWVLRSACVEKIPKRLLNVV
jgi:hypothetical protein